MKFPLTREHLKNINKYVQEDIVEHTIETLVNDIKDHIIAHAHTPFRKEQGGVSRTALKIDISVGLYCIPNKWVEYIHQQTSHLSFVCQNPYKDHLEVIKQKLMDLFPGVSFETDPLNTYLLIDWS